MARATDTPMPHALRLELGEVVTLLDEAEEHAPAAISDDITRLGRPEITLPLQRSVTLAT